MSTTVYPRSDDISTLQQKTLGAAKLVHRDCPMCGDGNADTPPSRYSMGIWTVKDCRVCGFTYIDTAPEYDALYDQMAWDKTAKVEVQWRRSTRPMQEFVDRWTRWRLHLAPRRSMPELLSRYADPGNVVDLGCGGGAQFKGLGSAFVPHGIEISRAAAADADAYFRGYGGYAVNATCLEGLRQFPSGYFSAATLRSYLEHELHPAEVLAELRRTMAPGGIAIVKVPNYGSLNRRVMGRRWCGFRHPDHLNYFTPASLSKMARRCGFRTWSPGFWRLPTGDNMWALLRKEGPTA